MANPGQFSLSSCSFDLYTNEISQWFVPDIISEGTLSRLQQMFHALPGKTTNALGLEFHKNKSIFDCDVSLSIDPFVDKKELLAWRPDEFSRNCHNNELISDAKIIPEIVNAWENHQTRLAEVLKELFLEFDLRGSQKGNIPLNIFLTLLQNRDPVNTCRIISAFLADKLDVTRQGVIRSCLEQVAKIPKNLFITHLGFMLGRPSRAIRVLIRCETSDLCNLLRILGLNAVDYASFSNFFSIILPRCSYVVLAINMFEYGVGADFGIECGYLGTANIESDEWWPDFIDAIGTLGNWEDQVSTMLRVEVLKKKRREQNISKKNIEWGLNHIKVSFSAQALPSMKWYIAMHGVNFENL